MIKAKIRFRDGSVQVGVGRVVNREGVPWTSVQDCRRHIASIEGLEIVEVWEEPPSASASASPA